MTENISERLQEIINSSGLSQRDFAGKAGCSTSLITEVLKGRSNLSKRTARAISTVFHVNEGWLLTGEGDKVGHSDEKIEFAVRERHAAGWECKGEEFSEFEMRIIGMLRRLTPETRQDHFDGITTSYFHQMEKEIEARDKKS